MRPIAATPLGLGGIPDVEIVCVAVGGVAAPGPSPTFSMPGARGRQLGPKNGSGSNPARLQIPIPKLALRPWCHRYTRPRTSS